MSRYEAYVPSNVRWLDDIPAHWTILKLRQILRPFSQKNHPELPLLSVVRDKGVIVRDLGDKESNHNYIPKDLSGYRVVNKGQLAMNKMKAWQGSYGISDYTGIVSPAYFVFDVDFENLQYFHRAIRSKVYVNFFAQASDGIRVGQWDLDINKLKEIPFVIPPCEEQEQIVRYLDWQVSKINKLIAGKKKAIKNIAELKKAIVNEAVTHGLNKEAPMKYSGVEWLGDIPAHWTTIKLRQILHPFSEKSHSELPLLSIVREQGVIVRDVEDKESNRNYIPDDLSGYKLVRKGQFAINKMKAWQGSYGVSDYTGIVSPAYFVFDVDFDNLQYFHYALRSKVYVNFFAQASDGIRVGQWDLDIDKMKEIPFIVPPADEQQAIVDYIPKAFEKYEATLATLNEEISVLHELRDKLISDVVTGQIDVRDVEVPEFEYVEEAIDGPDEESDDCSDDEEV